MLKTCPAPVDVQDLQFKLQCKLKIFDTKDTSVFQNLTNIVSCASRYGLIFCGTQNSNFQVILTKCINDYNPKDKGITNYQRRTIPLPGNPTNICVNCDSTILAVIYEKNQYPFVIFYDVLSFYKQNITVIKETQLSAIPNVFTREIDWNPSIPNIFTVCKSDGSLSIYEIKENALDVKDLPPAALATSFCWSPKGKQIAVGSRDGKITQYKPDLKAVKVINGPPLEGSYSLISLKWVSNYQFIGVYQSAQPEGAASLLVVDAPKTGETVFTNYEDVCYSGTGRTPQFYMNLQIQWLLLMVASSNSTEIGVLTATNDSWTQTIVPDFARAELPLSSDHQETFPIGMDVDISSTVPIPWGESSLPPCPRLLLLSDEGLLCIFNIVNLKEGVPTLCAPPDGIVDMSGISNFKSGDIENIANVPAKPINVQQNLNLFGGQVSLTPIEKTPISTSTDNKYSSIFESLGAPQNKAIPENVEQKTVIITSDKVEVKSSTPKIETKKIKPEVTKSEVILPETTETNKNDAETQLILNQMIKDECSFVEKELIELLKKGKSVHVNIGTENEKNDMVLKVESLKEFLKELTDISSGQSSEIQDLKQCLIQSWAWYEEAKSKYNTSKDETMTLVLKSQPLDSLAEKRLKDIQHITYYIESQLSQVNKALDEQWDQFQSYAKKQYSEKLPTMEAIFQVMVRQNGILQKQTYVLRDIASRLKKKSQNSQNLLVTDRVKELEKDFDKISIDSKNIYRLQYERILNKSKNLSTIKSNKLRNVLLKTEVKNVTAVKPQVSSLTITSNSPMTKSKLSSLTNQLSRIENTVVRTLKFGDDDLPSTPLVPTQKTSFFGTPGSAFVPPTKAIFESTRVDNTPKVPISFSANLFGNAQENKVLNKSSTKTVTVLQNSAPVNQKATLFGQVSTSEAKVPPVSSSFMFSSLASNKAAEPNVNLPTSFTFSSQKSPAFNVIGQRETAFASDNTLNKVVSSISASTASAFTPSTAVSTASSQPVTRFGTASAPKQTLTFKAPQTTTVVSSTSESSGNLLAKVPTSTNIPKSTATGIFTPSTNNTSIFSKATPTTTTNIFGATPATTTTNIFGQKTSTSSIFSTNSTGIFQQPKSTATSAISTTPSTITVSATIPSSTDSQKSTATTTSTPSLFGSLTSTTQASGQQSKQEKVEKVVTTTITPTIVSTSTPSIFAQATTATQKPTSLFKPQTTTTTSIFGAKSTPTSTSVAQPDSTTPTLSFGQPTSTAGSIFGQSSTTSPSKSIFGQPLVTSASIFGQTTTTSTASSVFAPPTSTKTTTTTTSTVPTTTTSSSSIFAQATTTASSNIFGNQPTSTVASGFGQPTTTASVFGQPASTVASVFGQPTSTTTTSVFGQPASSASSAFGQPVSTKTTSVFGQPASTTTSVFGQPASTTASVFGQPTSTAATFGQPASTAATFGQPASTTSSIFGQPASTTSSVFGQPVSTSASIFGQPTSTSASVFGQSTSVFGQPATTSVFGQQSGSIFGQQSTGSAPFGQQSPTTTASVFGQPASTFSGGSVFGSNANAAKPAFGSSGSIFGASTTNASVFGTPASSTNVFGSTTTPTTANSVFGSTQSSGFGSSGGSVFGNTSQTSTFGSGSSSFGFGGLNVGAATTTASSVFGGQTQANPFAKSDNTAGFGGGNIFAAAAPTSTPSVFGGSGSNATFGQASQGFGQQSTFGSQSVFGQQSKPVFGQNTFGSGTGFGSPQPGPFSGGSASGTAVAQSGFGSPATFQKPAGFGSFGSGSPAFGAAPSFGGSPSFGSAPTFGTPEKVFGMGASPSGGFGSPAAQQSPGFGNLANQNTIGFGNLAQQGNTGGSTPFSGNSSFSTWR